jgi:hypothetical protein
VAPRQHVGAVACEYVKPCSVILGKPAAATVLLVGGSVIFFVPLKICRLQNAAISAETQLVCASAPS